MKKTKTFKVFMYLILALLLFLGVYIPSIPLQVAEAVFVFLFVFAINSLYEKSYKLGLLRKEFANQQKLISDVFKYCPDAIFFKDSDFRYVDFNDAFLKNNARNSAEIVLNKTDFELLPKDLAQQLRDHDVEVIKKGKDLKYIETMIMPDGEKRVFEIIKTPFKQPDFKVGILGISRDVTENHFLQEKLLEKQAEFESIFDNMPYMAYLKDLDNNILVANDGLKKFFGISDSNVSMLLPSDIFKQDEVGEFKKGDMYVISEKKPIVTQKQVCLNDETNWFEVHKAPVLNQDGDVVRIVVLAKNIDAEKNIEAQKDTFVATLTHDLKTPTAAQIRSLGLLKEGYFGQLNQGQDEIVGQILNSSKYMLSMISTVLSTYRMENGHLKFVMEGLNFKELVQECVDELRYLAKEKGLCIETFVNLSDDSISCDGLELKRVITNLVSNAIAYCTPDSKIKISLFERAGETTFEITNTGKPLVQEELETLFCKYSSNAKSYRQIGTGLGLYLSRQIIEGHKGTMFARSETNAGNTFGFIIPKDTSEDLIKNVP